MSTVLESQMIKNDTQGAQKMNIVIIGHVDHGKSTLIGRLLADTHSLPKGKLEAVKAQCAYHARPFEYAFLLDALKDEQSQGITIDSARCFFKSKKREYILIDAPGHIEFLKNMISGAARAEAAVLVIDAHEGVQENSRRHGYLLGMLGIRQALVCVNKMDLAGYDRRVFERIRSEFSAFLTQTGITARHFIPISARDGFQVAAAGDAMPWYDGPTVLEALDGFEKEPPRVDQPLRLPIQDIYKFTEQGDNRRIFAGRIETGTLRVGDAVVFYPSGKRSTIASIEAFNAPPAHEAAAGQAVGVTLREQVYVQPGELLVRADEPPSATARQLRVNLFWMGREPMIFNKRYLLKLGTTRVPVWLRQIRTVLDASELTTERNRRHIQRHDVAECVLETLKPIAFDPTAEIAQTGRFVLIDNYHIAGGGVVLQAENAAADRLSEHVQQREKSWRRSRITPLMRSYRTGQRSTLVVIAGPPQSGKADLAQALEEKLFAAGRQVYYLGLDNSLMGIDEDISRSYLRDEYLRRLGEVAHLFTDAGMILITTVSDLDSYELQVLRTLNHPGENLIIGVGAHGLAASDVDLMLDVPLNPSEAAGQVANLLTERHYLPEYYL